MCHFERSREALLNIKVIIQFQSKYCHFERSREAFLIIKNEKTRIRHSRY